jgi:acetylornithine deacetylase/succinyl-diaminopimelate desuccinylase-like protein
VVAGVTNDRLDDTFAGVNWPLSSTVPWSCRRLRAAPLSILVAASFVAAPPLCAQQTGNLARLQDEAVRRTVEYLRINTTNPPGNENRTAAFFARIFTAEGIPFDSASSAPGRGNIWARLEGGSGPALVLLHHMDVVPADRRYWTVDPFSATTKDGFIYGRGALDTKTLGIVELEAFLSLHRSHARLARDVIFLATADEEAGGSQGAGWMIQHHPEAWAGAGSLLNEGGLGTEEGGRRQFGIEVTQKVPLWLRLIATDQPGHGSTPHVTTSVGRLVRALERLRTHRFAPHIVPVVDRYFKGLARSAAPEWRAAFADIGKAAGDSATLLRLQLAHPGLAALTRNTCSITMLKGSDKINVVPPRAEAQIDCRVLPDQKPDAFVRELVAVVDDSTITLERILGFTPAASSTDTPLYQAIVDLTRRHFPDVNVVPAISTGFTDSHFFRDRGIACYGFAPFLIPAADEGGVHGNNERISVENVRRGAVLMRELVEQVATTPERGTR